ncbi:MAG: NADH-quinone oxidoreductase subunit J [Pseudomonadota bacterium]
MTIYNIMFWVFSAILVGSALRVITCRNPVHAALYLVVTFFTCAVIWMLLESEFLAIVLVLVYVGAVMVLFLFVVMMLDVNVAPMQEGFVKNLPVGIVVGVLMVIEMAMLIVWGNFGAESFPTPTPKSAEYSNAQGIGAEMYANYLFHVEVAGLILLLAIVAAIALTMRKRPETKYQTPSQQVTVKKSDRLRIVSMDAEK